MATKYVPLYLDTELVDAIDVRARYEDRSRAGMIRQLIRQALGIYPRCDRQPEATRQAGEADDGAAA